MKILLVMSCLIVFGQSCDINNDDIECDIDFIDFMGPLALPSSTNPKPDGPKCKGVLLLSSGERSVDN